MCVDGKVNGTFVAAMGIYRKVVGGGSVLPTNLLLCQSEGGPTGQVGPKSFILYLVDKDLNGETEETILPTFSSL